MVSPKDFAIADSIGKRNAQEDFCSYSECAAMEPLPHITVVADGMGGHAAGEVASRLATESFLAACKGHTPGAHDMLGTALDTANSKIADYTAANPDVDGMGCTLIAVEVQEGARAYRWISVGDSLLLSVTPEKIERINEDHSFREAIGRAEAAGESTAGFPSPNILRSAVMGLHMPLIDDHAAWRSFAPGETLVIATDGLDTLPPEQIRQIVNAGGEAGAIAKALISAVEHVGKPKQDNTTIAVLKSPVDPLRELSPTRAKPKAEAERWVSTRTLSALGLGVLGGGALMGAALNVVPGLSRYIVPSEPNAAGNAVTDTTANATTNVVSSPSQKPAPGSVTPDTFVNPARPAGPQHLATQPPEAGAKPAPAAKANPVPAASTKPVPAASTKPVPTAAKPLPPAAAKPAATPGPVAPSPNAGANAAAEIVNAPAP